MESRSDADGPWRSLRSRLGAATDPRACLESLMADGWFDDHLDVVAEMPSVSAGPEKYHGEGDLWSHTLLVVEEMHALRPHDPQALLMALVHDIGKLRTAEAADTGTTTTGGPN
jgi:tRNA nucleotidyltransferase (CCA-adding enzyme)